MRPVDSRRLPRWLSARYRSISYDKYVDVAWYSADSAGELLRYAEAATSAMSTALSSAAGDAALVEQERDSVDRLLCNWRWKGMFPFPYVTGRELIIDNADQATFLEAALNDVANALTSAAREVIADDVAMRSVINSPYPVNKSKGAPFWFTGRQIDSAYGLASIVANSGSLDDIREWCVRLGSDFDLLILLLTRIQAALNARTVYAATPQGHPYDTGTVGHMSKVRKVQAVPNLMNVCLAEIGALMLAAARKSGLGILPTIKEAELTCAGYSPDKLVAEDVSNFDDSVGLELWLRAVEVFVYPFCDALAPYVPTNRLNIARNVMDEIATTPIMIPPLSYSEGARIIERAGAIPSGVRLTSVLGSFINNARVRAALRSVDVSLDAVKILTFGDDTLVAFDRVEDATKYRDAMDKTAAATGFKTKPAPDAAFLMRRMPSGYGYVGRMLLSTLQKEEALEPRSVPTAALGIASRRAIIKGNPFAHVYDDLLQSGALGPRLQAAYNTAAASGWNIPALGNLVYNEVGLAQSGASRAHTDESLADLVEELEAMGYDVGAWGDAAKATIAASNPPVTDIFARAQETYGDINEEQNFARLRQHIREWRGL